MINKSMSLLTVRFVAAGAGTSSSADRLRKLGDTAATSLPRLELQLILFARLLRPVLAQTIGHVIEVSTQSVALRRTVLRCHLLDLV